jgi:N-acetylmuramoyl-L-alanine amidase
MAGGADPISRVQTFALWTVPSFSPPDHLRARIVAAAFDDNVSTMQGRLPPRLLARSRLLQWMLRHGWLLLASTGVVIATLTVMRSSRVSTVVVRAPRLAINSVELPAVRAALDEAAAGPSEVLDGSLRADVLALGVRRVIIDAGHGGAHPGTRSATGTLEKDVTLDIAQRLRRLVVQSGLEAVMTRTDDNTLSLQQRADLANGQRGDIFVSVHLNSIQPSTTRGIETYYLGLSDGPEPDAVAEAENQHSGYSLADMRHLLDRIYADARRDESRRLAEAVQLSLVHTLRKTEPALTDRGVKTAPFIVLVATEMPAVLAEVSCLSNASEAGRLTTPEYRQTIAEALAAGIQTFVNQTHVNEPERTQTSGSRKTVRQRNAERRH